MLIGEALLDCIHPHSDAIYRSAAGVQASPSLDNEINKLSSRQDDHVHEPERLLFPACPVQTPQRAAHRLDL